MKKCVFIVSLVILLLFSLYTNVYADVSESLDYGGNLSDIRNWQFKYDKNQSLPESVAKLVGLALKATQVFSIIATVIVTSILGVKYMMDSAEERAAEKRKFINIIIGVVMLTTITSVISAIFTMVDGFLVK